MTWLLVPTVLAASLLGSIHCAAMCGAFACMASDRSGESDLRLQIPYQGGRLLAYLVLGAIAGVAGHSVTTLGGRAGLAHGASLAMGLLLVVWGGGRIARHLRRSSHPTTRPPEWWQKLAGGWLRRAREAAPERRALLTGLVTGLLPCGWLWVFVAVAAGTGRPLAAMVVMAVFWVGSLPALVGVVIGARHLGAHWQQRLPLVSASLILLLGIMSLAGHLGWLPLPRAWHEMMPAGLVMPGTPHG